MSRRWLSDVRTAYREGDVVVVEDLPEAAASVSVRTARGERHDATYDGRRATFARLPAGTHAIEARDASGALLAEELCSVTGRAGEDPVMGFVTSFDDASRASVLSWLRELRCTVVQVYDWMDGYSYPAPAGPSYEDPLGRRIDTAALKSLIAGVREFGAVAQAYAPVCAADRELADAHPEWRLFRNDGAPQSLGDLLQIMDPGSAGWQRHWIEQYATAADELGLNGWHLDTYGHPRVALDHAGAPVVLRERYGAFVAALRAARPGEVVSFNQVNGVDRGVPAPGRPSFRYVEVWPPNDRWRHFEGLLERSRGAFGTQGDTLAIYPPVWGGERSSALRTAVMSEAVATTLGANTLIWGDDDGVLAHPYYVEHERLRGPERATALAWRRFGLRCRDLFRLGTDTSWYELADENASVVVHAVVPVGPEPSGGGLYARIRRSEDTVTVSLVDLTGSADGSWTRGTSRGLCGEARVDVLVDSPDRWRADVAVLGRDEGRFAKVSVRPTTMREGLGLSCVVPLVDGWSVLRLVATTGGEATSEGAPGATEDS
jgi:dextranase